jgi:hypothetical protein
MSAPVRNSGELEELTALGLACQENWSEVRPVIFGTLFEQSLDRPQRHAFGAHFTSAADIHKVVLPTMLIECDGLGLRRESPGPLLSVLAPANSPALLLGRNRRSRHASGGHNRGPHERGPCH